MISLLAIDWLALAKVTGTTIVAACLIGTLMSLANWFFTPEEGLDKPLRAKMVLGWIMVAAMGVIVLYGIWLIVPYFHPKK